MGTDYQAISIFEFQKTWHIYQKVWRIFQKVWNFIEIYLELYSNSVIFGVNKVCIICMAKKHFVSSKRIEHIDPETGEITTTETDKLVTVNLGKQEEFFMVFCNYLSSFYGLKYADDIKMVVKLNEWAQFDTGHVDLTPSKRLDIMNGLGMRNDAISKSLKRLRDKGLISGDRGSYVINPIIFWKGDKAKRKDLLAQTGVNFQVNFNIEK